MNWRPDNWVNPYVDASTTQSGSIVSSLRIIYENGADAMLEALREQGDCSLNRAVQDGITYATGLQTSKGKWVFIPDE